MFSVIQQQGRRFIFQTPLVFPQKHRLVTVEDLTVSVVRIIRKTYQTSNMCSCVLNMIDHWRRSLGRILKYFIYKGICLNLQQFEASYCQLRFTAAKLFMNRWLIYMWALQTLMHKCFFNKISGNLVLWLFCRDYSKSYCLISWPLKVPNMIVTKKKRVPNMIYLFLFNFLKKEKRTNPHMFSGVQLCMVCLVTHHHALQWEVQQVVCIRTSHAFGHELKPDKSCKSIWIDNEIW